MKYFAFVAIVVAVIVSAEEHRNCKYHFIVRFNFDLIFNLIFLLKDVCSLPPFTDGFNGVVCKGYFPSHSYDAATNKCKFFIYGSCGGNANRFNSKEACEEMCLDRAL